MPRKKIPPSIPFANVGDAVRATNGKMYIILRVEGSKAWLKSANRDGTVGPGHPCIGYMTGDASNSTVANAGDSSMAGKVTSNRLITVDIL